MLFRGNVVGGRHRSGSSRFVRFALAIAPILTASVILAAPAWATTTVACPTGNLQDAINAASLGSTINVSGTCTGTFFISQDLTLVGPAVLDGGGSGTVLHVDSGAAVTVTALTIQHGAGSGFEEVAGGISNDGTLTLNSSTV